MRVIHQSNKVLSGEKMFEIKIETDFVPLTIYQDFPQGISKIGNKSEKRDLSGGGLAVVLFGFASSVTAIVLGAWIYDKIKNKPNTIIRINNKETTIDKSGIIRVIEKEIEIQNK